IAASSLVFVAAAAAEYYRRKSKACKRVIPKLGESTDSGHGGRKIERFPNYVARQLGFSDPSECPQLCELAYDYLRRKEGSEDNIYDYFAADMEDRAKSLCGKLTEELERERRFERVSRSLKVTRVFSTLVEEMKKIGKTDFHRNDVMVPAAHSDRSPVLLFMGGGMGAGKSTVIKDILKESFWGGAAANAVVVEADAFKESDVIYKALNSMGHHDDMLRTSELVHQSSTDAASSLLVTALNEGRDVIMDGTLSWEPFVEQTVEMARNVHKRRYRMGIGYKVDGTTITENYWEPVQDEVSGNEEMALTKRPYRIEMVGVVCDAYLAVARGIRRAIITGRAVRVNSQLKSHKRFANAFPGYCELVDNARLYCTNSVGGPPKLIARKDGDNTMLIDPDHFKCLKNVGRLNPNAESVHELYGSSSTLHETGSVWKDVVFSPSRTRVQEELKMVIEQIEGPLRL
ncbi:Calmodulin calcium-dependent NAD kinase, partial [Linum perenne]